MYITFHRLLVAKALSVMMIHDMVVVFNVIKSKLIYYPPNVLFNLKGFILHVIIKSNY